jgi:hypothetical protein
MLVENSTSLKLLHPEVARETWDEHRWTQNVVSHNLPWNVGLSAETALAKLFSKANRRFLMLVNKSERVYEHFLKARGMFRSSKSFM